MAEIVEYRVGKTLNEIDILIKFGLLNDQQAGEITKKREGFEYTLRRRTSDKLHFLRYIKFEMNLLMSIEQYQKTIARKSSEDKIFELQAKKLDDIIRGRVGHISFLYRKVIMKNQFDKRLWIAYIEFAKQRKLLSRVSALYWRLLRVVNQDESLWVSAAEFEIDLRQDINTARKLLLLGLRHNPESNLIKEKLKSICDLPALAEQQTATPGDEGETVGHQTSETQAKAINKRSKMDMLYECYDSKGLEETRLLYKTLNSSVKNQTLSLYVGMIQVEMWQLARNKEKDQLDRIRSIYDKALEKFGQHKAKLWYEYIQLEHRHAQTLDDFDKINRLYKRALSSLEPSKVDRVIEKYTLLQHQRSRQVDVEYSDYSDLEDS